MLQEQDGNMKCPSLILARSMFHLILSYCGSHLSVETEFCLQQGRRISRGGSSLETYGRKSAGTQTKIGYANSGKFFRPAQKFRHWRWRQNIPPKCTDQPITLHIFTSHKTTRQTTAAVRAEKLRGMQRQDGMFSCGPQRRYSVSHFATLIAIPPLIDVTRMIARRPECWNLHSTCSFFLIMFNPERYYN
jgi:hypothetical protein